MNRTLLFFVALLFLACGSVMFWTASNNPAPETGSVAEVDDEYVAPVKVVTEFEFVDQLGKPFHSRELAGKVWMGTFFFANCPSICVQQNTEISKLHLRFRDKGVMCVGISVAPDEDTPTELWKYANRFSADHNSWKFLTGKDIEYVRQVGHDIFGLVAADETHSPDVAVFDRAGKIHGTYNVMKPVEYAKCVQKVDELLAEEVVAADSTDEVEAEADSDVPETADSKTTDE